ncbi:MAG: hypothetical protein LBT59_20690 [Clostridiales bacterium]|nr:hypothetical protein [Clostridiales bacterium]
MEIAAVIGFGAHRALIALKYVGLFLYGLGPSCMPAGYIMAISAKFSCMAADYITSISARFLLYGLGSFLYGRRVFIPHNGWLFLGLVFTVELSQSKAHAYDFTYL